jgi:predicted metal-dependent hydrolase
MIDWLRKEMLEPEIVLGDQVLPIELRRNARAKRLTLRLAPDGSAVRITMPQWARAQEAIAFAHKRQEWLEEQLVKIPSRAEPVPGGTVQFRGDALTIDWDEKRPRTCRFTDDRVTLGGPRASLTTRLQRALESQALDLFQHDRDFYCERASLPPAPVRLSRAQRRWGSCSDKKAMRINWRLVQAPDYVRRSVVAHEVTHLVHFDHSRAFHAMLGDLFEGDIKRADRWLKDNGRTLYASFG